MKLLILELDTIRKPKSSSKFIGHPQDQQIIEGADRAIAHYHREGYIIVGISNQGGVAAGHKSFSDCFLEQRYTLNLFPQMSELCFCPDFKGLECWVVNQMSPIPISASSFGYEGADFRQPGAGLIKFALWQHDVAPVDSLYVGDCQEDADVANAAGVIFFWADAWRDRWVSSKPILSGRTAIAEEINQSY